MKYHSNLINIYILSMLLFFSCGDSGDPAGPDLVSGCTDEAACNHNLDATSDDASCVYAATNYDCDGNCTTTEDCTGECGGTAVVDECGTCGGSGATAGCGCDDIPSGDCDCNGNILDCANECGGTAVVDDCGVCNGSGPATNFDCDGNCIATVDCAGVCGGTAAVDECGECGGDDVCVSYASQIEPIFANNCTNCHSSGSNPSGGLNLTSYATLMSNDVIIEGDAENSTLYLKISGTEAGQRMPRDNQSYFNSHTDEMQLIVDWINEGAEDN